MENFRKDLEELINKHSLENGSNTPDITLSVYLLDCLKAFDKATHSRDFLAGRLTEEQYSKARMTSNKQLDNNIPIIEEK